MTRIGNFLVIVLVLLLVIESFLVRFSISIASKSTS